MEEVLRRLLEAERSADDLIKRSETEAEAILVAGRKEAETLKTSLTQEISDEVKSVLETAVKKAESDKRAALEQSNATREEAVATLRRNFDAAVKRVTCILTAGE